MPHQFFHRPDHVFLINEAHLDIELRKFGLPVGTQILITEATHNLIVTIQSRHH